MFDCTNEEKENIIELLESDTYENILSALLAKRENSIKELIRGGDNDDIARGEIKAYTFVLNLKNIIKDELKAEKNTKM